MRISDFQKKIFDKSNQSYDPGKKSYGDFDENDITTYPINEIVRSGRFTHEERSEEYRRRGKSPSGVIDGIYNDMYRGNDEYNDAYRDWEADA